MNVSRFISKKLKIKGTLAVICISVSFFVMIVAVSVSAGFRNEIRNSLAGMTGDVMIMPVNMNYIDAASPIDRHPPYLDGVRALEGVADVRPSAWRAGMVKTEDGIHGVLFKGIEGEAGQLEVSIPSRLSRMLGLVPGDDMVSYFIGDRVRMRKFKVRDVYEGMLETDDQLVVYADISDIQRLNGWTENQVSAFEVMLDEDFRDAATMKMMAGEIGHMIYSDTAEDNERVVAEASVSRYPQLFDWLDLIDFNVLFILILMTIVAGFNMISGLLIILFEHISTIGLLKALGMKDRAIAGIFLHSASSIVLKGMFWGNHIAFVFILIQRLTHVIKLDPDNYFIDFVPVRLDIVSVLAADAAVYAAIMLLLLIPSLFISRVDPVKTLAVR